MKLYYSPGACSLTIRILAHELNIPFEFEAVNLKIKQTASGQDFLTINAKGAVPTLMLDNQELLTENTVILQYLADQYSASQFLPPIANWQRYRVLEWLNFVSTDLHKNCGPLFNPKVPSELKQDVFLPILKNKLPIVENQLAKNAYLAGDHYSLADIYLLVVLRWLPHLGLGLSEWPSIEKYFTALKNRDAVKKALQEELL